MSTRKGAGSTRTRKPAHQNSFAFRHNPKSQKTAKILGSLNSGLCASCHDKVEWRKKYRKYRPLRKPATCNDCHKKTITAAYHRICEPCAKERRVCPFCCTKGRPRADPSEGDGDEDEEQEEGDAEGDEKVGPGEMEEEEEKDGVVHVNEGGVRGEGEILSGGACSGSVEMEGGQGEGRGSSSSSRGGARGEEREGGGNAMDDCDGV